MIIQDDYGDEFEDCDVFDDFDKDCDGEEDDKRVNMIMMMKIITKIRIKVDQDILLPA